MRLSFVRKMRYFPETRVAPDGIAYSWAEFDNYSDTDMATEIWILLMLLFLLSPRKPRPLLVSYRAPSFGSLQTGHLASIPCTLRESLWRRFLILLMKGIATSLHSEANFT